MNGPWPQIVNEKFFWCSATWKDVLRSLLQLRNPIFGVKSCMDCWNRKWYVRDTKVQVREFLNGMHCTETGKGNRAKKAASNVYCPTPQNGQRLGPIESILSWRLSAQLYRARKLLCSCVFIARPPGTSTAAVRRRPQSAAACGLTDGVDWKESGRHYCRLCSE